MGKIIAFANQKGGVGKTTTAINLAAALSERGKRVLLCDFDPQGNATSGFGVDPRSLETSVYDLIVSEDPDTKSGIVQTKWVDIIGANVNLAGAELDLIAMDHREARLKLVLDKVKDEYDYVFIDCPPSLGLLTLNCLCAADSFLVPLQCEYYALEGLSQLMTTVRMVKKNMNPKLSLEGVLLTMFDGRTNLSIQVVEEVKKHFPGEVFSSVVPRNVRLSEAPSHGKPITEYDRMCRGAEAYLSLADEILAKNGKGKDLKTETSADSVSKIAVSRIEPNPGQPRKVFAQEALDELAESIRLHGVITPITVRAGKKEGYYQIIAGERRWRAARQAGLDEIPAMVIEASESEVMELALIENLQRQDLNPIEEAEGYEQLMRDYGLTQEQVAQRVVKSRPAVANALRLLQLPGEVRTMVSKGELSGGHARAVLAVAEENKRVEAAKQMAGMTVRQAEALAKRMNKKPAEPKPQESDFSVDYIAALEKELESVLGRKICIQQGKNSGQLTLEYYGADDLERLTEALRALRV